MTFEEAGKAIDAEIAKLVAQTDRTLHRRKQLGFTRLLQYILQHPVKAQHQPPEALNP